MCSSESNTTQDTHTHTNVCFSLLVGSSLGFNDVCGFLHFINASLCLNYRFVFSVEVFTSHLEVPTRI